MTCDRCTPSRLCLNHEREAVLRERLARDDHREALARGQARYERNSKETRGWA